MVRTHPLFKINIAEQGTSHRIIATHRNLNPNARTVNHKYGNQATNFSSLLDICLVAFSEPPSDSTWLENALASQ
jgi:hypothetical protein